MENTVVVYDLEYTSWEGAHMRGWTGPHEYREIIQIGAVKIDAGTFEEHDAVSLLIQPILNPILSEYIISLTGITQTMLKKDGVPFKEGLAHFAEWVGQRSLYAWGIDGTVLQDNCRKFEEVCPFPQEQLRNIKPLFVARGIDADRYMSSTIPEAFGKRSPFTGHDGLNDARSIVLALHELKKIGEVVL